MNIIKRVLFASVLVLPMTLIAADKLAPSQNPPAGLKVESVPQFIVFGFDDNGYSGLDSVEGGIAFVQSYLNSKKNSDGSKVTATFYVKANNIVENDYEDVKNVREALNTAYKEGNEIGNHTFSHGHGVIIDWEKDPPTRKDNYDLKTWLKEIGDATITLAKPYLAGSNNAKNGLGVAPKDIVGFRTPFLEYNNSTFNAIEKLNFSYDCSIEEGWEENQDATNQFWPYTLDKASPGDEASAKSTFELKKGIVGKHPGIWEFSCPVVIVPPDSVCKKYGVEPGLRVRMNKTKDYCEVSDGKITGLDWNLWFDFFVSKEEFIAIWEYTLDQHLAGNRSPFTFGYHSDIYSDKYDKNDCDDLDGGESKAIVRANAKQRREAFKTIVDYALTKDVVRIISAKELMNWMRNPKAL